MRKSTTETENKKTPVKAVKPRAKRTTVAELRKELDALKATNLKLLNDIGQISSMYFNAVTDKNKATREMTSRQASSEKESVIMATKRVIAFLMQTYGFAFSDLTK